MIHFTNFPELSPSAPEFSISSTVTSRAGRYYSAATAAPKWAPLQTRTAQTGRGWLLTQPASAANIRH
jgi:hypothetical protein